jgi:hypothetical protein
MSAINRVARLAGLAVVACALVAFGVREDFHNTHVIAGLIWKEHTALARTFYARAAAGDSAGLVALSEGREPVEWGLEFGRIEPNGIAAAARAASPINSSRRGADSVLTFYAVPARWCPQPDEPHTLEILFTRRNGTWRISYAGTEIC